MQVPPSTTESGVEEHSSSRLISTSAVQENLSGTADSGQDEESVNVSGEFARLGSGAPSGMLQGLLSSADPLVQAHSSLSGGAVQWHRSLSDVRCPSKTCGLLVQRSAQDLFARALWYCIGAFSDVPRRAFWPVQVPSELPCIVVANEFLDALPVHIFRRDEQRGWLEVLVDEPPTSTSKRVCSCVFFRRGEVDCRMFTLPKCSTSTH